MTETREILTCSEVTRVFRAALSEKHPVVHVDRDVIESVVGWLESIEMLAEAERKWAHCETLLATALSLLPSDMPVLSLRRKRDELNEAVSALVRTRGYLRELCRRAQASGQASPFHQDIEAFLSKLDKIDLIRSRAS